MTVRRWLIAHGADFSVTRQGERSLYEIGDLPRQCGAGGLVRDQLALIALTG
jgi:hypothetical protein